MKKIYDNLNYLRLGASPSDYPIFSQLLFTKGGDAFTCNGSEFVCIHDVKLDLDGGAINLYVLENILKLFDGDVGEYVIEGDKVLIDKGNFKTDLNISRMELPSLDFGDVDTYKVTEELLTNLKKAVDFTGQGILEYVYLCEDYLCATNGARVVVIDKPDYVGEPIGLSKKIISTLKVGDSIGTKDNNIVLYFKDGYAVFTVDKVDTYPSAKIKKFIDTSFEKTEELFDLASLKGAFSQVETVLFKETKKLVNLQNKPNTLLFIQANSINGEAKTSISRVSDKEFEMVFDINLVRGIAENYNVLISDVNDKLLLCDLTTKIIIMRFN